MKTTATNKKLRILLKGIDDETLIPRPDFQRRLVWKNDEKIEFIRTVLDGYPFPEIYVAAGEVDAETAEAVEYLVDGQQRITTLYAYWKNNGDVKISDEIPLFDNLEPEKQTEFMQYEVVVRDLGELPIDEIKSIFRKINATSYSLNAMEIHNSRYDGHFKKFAESISELSFFEDHRTFNSSDYKRMNDVRYCLALISTMMSNYFDGDDEIESFLSNYNDEFPQKVKIKKRIDSVIKFIEECEFLENSRVWNKADLFTVFVEINVLLQKDLSETTLKKRLKSFYKVLDNADDPEKLTEGYFHYYKAALQGSNSKSRRITRGRILREFLETGKIPTT